MKIAMWGGTAKAGRSVFVKRIVDYVKRKLNPIIRFPSLPHAVKIAMWLYYKVLLLIVRGARDPSATHSMGRYPRTFLNEDIE